MIFAKRGDPRDIRGFEADYECGPAQTQLFGEYPEQYSPSYYKGLSLEGILFVLKPCLAGFGRPRFFVTAVGLKYLDPKKM